jgi:CBS domain-containing protein
MRAREIMTPHPVVVTPDEPLAHAAAIMRERNIGSLPVVNDRTRMRLEGILTDRDIVTRCVAMRHDGRCRVRDHMTSGHIDTAGPEAGIGEVIAKMERDQVRRIPIVAPDGSLVGIIAQADLAVKLGPKEPVRVEHLLEEISEPIHLQPRL